MSASALWILRGGRELRPAPFCVYGIVNVTPDSFYDGGLHDTAESAITHGRRLVGEGAHVLDIGAESSRPYAPPVPLEDELARVLPVVDGLRGLTGNDGAPVPLSVDTYKAGTAEAVLEAGVDIINDISACAFDPSLRDVLAQYRPGYVLMHSLGRPTTMQDAPRYANVVDDIVAFFERELATLVRAGLPEANIVLDPGIGFGKTLEHNLAILREIEHFATLGRPVFMGLSNKSLFGVLLGLGPHERGVATQVATALLASRGVRYHRVHDVAETVRTLRVVSAMAAV